VRDRRPRLVLLGSSCCLFADELPALDCVTVYDASHVAGLIVAGVFPNPLDRCELVEGRAEASRVVDCARALGEALLSLGCSVVQVDGRCTDTHTIVLVDPEPAATSVRLEEAGICVSACGLPPEWGAGLRLGSQELVRRGMQRSHMETVAKLIVRARQGDLVAGEVAALALSFPEPT
jgi:glycine/serine hydroxymethyltransferase